MLARDSLLAFEGFTQQFSNIFILNSYAIHILYTLFLLQKYTIFVSILRFRHIPFSILVRCNQL